jgi:hypothetical protein
MTNQPFEAMRRVRRNLGVEAGVAKQPRRPSARGCMPSLAPVQLGVGRHRGKTGVPDAEDGFRDIRAVLGGDRDRYRA